MIIRRLIAVILAAGAAACAHPRQNPAEIHEASIPAQAAAPREASPRLIDFTAQIQPILEKRCQPCHFPGGKLYERLPFDRPETIVYLGDKLFTRIKDENEQRMLREFLAQEASADGTFHGES